MQAIEGELILAKQHPKPPKLRTVRDCRRELASVYADARNGIIPAADATKLSYILVAIVNVIRDHEIEQRLEKLEEQSNNGNT